MEGDTDEEEMEDINLDNERESHLRMVLNDNHGGVDNTNALIHAKRWDVYANEK